MTGNYTSDIVYELFYLDSTITSTNDVSLELNVGVIMISVDNYIAKNSLEISAIKVTYTSCAIKFRCSGPCSNLEKCYT